MHNVAAELGPQLCDALPEFHALTGCNSNSSMFGIGKKQAFKTLRRSDLHQTSVSQLGKGTTLSEDTTLLTIKRAVHPCYFGNNLAKCWSNFTMVSVLGCPLPKNMENQLHSTYWAHSTWHNEQPRTVYYKPLYTANLYTTSISFSALWMCHIQYVHWISPGKS